MNQLLEHTKEIFWIFGEISRVLKPKGMCIVGVPNLASFHNRLFLCGGRQPTSIRMLGPHVRGITKKDFIDFIETDGFFKVTGFKGSNFYPFPCTIAKVLSKLFPSAAVSIFFQIQRTEREGNFLEVLDTRFFETPWWKGES